MRNCSKSSRAVIKKSLLLLWHMNLNEHWLGVPGEPFDEDFIIGAIDTWNSRLMRSANARKSGDPQTRGSSELGGMANSASKGT